jgi:hypothetical protein
MDGLGAYQRAFASTLLSTNPGMTEAEAVAKAQERYDEHDNSRLPVPSEKLTPKAAEILATYSDGGAPPSVATFGEQNEFLAANLGELPRVFGGAVIMRTASPVADKPGVVEVTLTGVPEVPRPKTSHVVERFRVNVAGKQKARRLEPRTTGAFLRRLVYTNNKTQRCFSDLLVCLGPKPSA